ncbi:guanylate kinase [Gorgonomyces haynaldii]|nr:guanylate kinase [Gorgonomyces haynaldii]
MKQCLVVSGPSGSGKSTLLNRLFAKYPNTFGFSVSHTTRQPRPGETPGVSYHYIQRSEFNDMVEKNKFVEHAEFANNCYGTSIDAIEHVKKQNLIPVLDLEIKGVKSIKKTDLSCKFIFIQPPSIEALEQRLRDRKTETEESLKKRLDTAKEAMDYAQEQGAYDVIVINDKEEEAYKQLEEYVIKNWNLTRVQPVKENKQSKFCALL